jgi:PAS domain S-box-containing protein
VRAAAIHDENGSTSYIEGVVENIDARVEAEKDSRVKSYLLDHANDAIFVHDAKARISYVNETACINLGYSRQEILDMPLSKLDTPENAAKLQERFDQLFDQGKAVFESAHVKKDGGIVPVEVHARLVDVDGEKQVLSIARDITERKAYEERLSRINRSLRLLSEGNRVLVKADDPQELLDEICRIIVETGGYRAAWAGRAEDSQGKPVVPVAHAGFDPDHLKQLNVTWEDTETGRCPMGKAIRNGQTCVLQDVEADPDFSPWREKTLSSECRATVATPVKTGQQVWGALGIYADHKNAFSQAEIQILEEMASDLAYGLAAIENRIECEKAEAEKHRLEKQVRQSQKMEALGTLAGGIAHDFNNILSAVIGYAELSLDELDPDSLLGKNIRQVVHGGYRARDLVTQILTFTRQSEQEPQPVQVKLIVKEAAKLLQASLPATIEIHEEIKSDSLVRADPVQIHQIVMNLCTNAGYAMADAGGQMSIRLDETAFEAGHSMGVYRLLPGRYIRLTVEDTGPGIPGDIVDRIFEPYFTTKEKGEGTGMGLSVVHGIVDGLGGGIDIKTRPGKGTVFDVYLPVMAAGEKQPEAEAENQLPGGTGHVMFVDDEPSVVNMGRLMLESLGYSASACSSGTEALEKFRQTPEQFDLVITDMTMPRMTGLELAREIAEIRPDIPIVLSTGYSSKILANVTWTTSIKEVARKPISKKDLAHLLSRVLSNSKGQEGPGE